MTSQEFCYWLQGFFELDKPKELSADQTQLIQKHLDMVFIHEIDKSYPESQQEALNEVHNTNLPYGAARC